MLQPNHIASRHRESGAALIMALGMLILFFALGTQYVRYMAIEVEDTKEDTARNQSRQLAYGGIYAAIGKVQAALSTGQAVDSDASIELPVFETIYRGRDQGISLDRSDEPVSVTITESGQSGGLAGALEAAGLQGAALTAVSGSARETSEGRVFQITSYVASESGSHAAEALVAFDSDGGYKIRFWREGRVADLIADETDTEPEATADGGDEASSESNADPGADEDTTETGEE